MANYNSSRTGLAHDGDEDRLISLENKYTDLTYGIGITGPWNLSINGNATTASQLDYFPQLTTDTAIDSFNETNKFQVATWNSTSSPGVSNGIILNGCWTNTNYGFQLAIDDDPTYWLALRQRNGNGWNTWKRIPMGDGTGASGTWGINITGSATYATSYLAQRGSVSGSSHAVALKNYFNSYKSSEPRNALIAHYSSAYGNGSLCMGYFLSGYDSNPYGGFFVCHYNSAKYVGIQNGTYTEYEISKSATSSIRIKDNVKNMNDEEAKKLLKITPVSFDYKPGYGKKDQIGFIAEELEDILPRVVYIPNYDPETEEKPLQSIQYSDFVPYLVKLAQLQQEEINTLKQKVEQLEQVINNGKL